MVPSMLESIFFYILQKSIQGYDSHFLCARVMVHTMHIFWRVPAELCWRWSFMYSGVTFDLKNAPAIYDAIMRVLPPPMAAATTADVAIITARLTP
jgi:hypothetical protein